MIRYYEALMSHPKYGWMAVCVAGSDIDSATEEADFIAKHLRPGWVITLSGDHSDHPTPDAGGPH